jgi:hypothetical protein
MKVLRSRLNAVELGREMRLSREAQAVQTADADPIAFFQALAGREDLHADALRCLPGLLPRRVGVWWGSLCLWEMARQKPNPLAEMTLGAVLRWIQQPTRQHRLAAEAPAKAGDLNTAAGCLAWAVFWSAGSLTPPNLPVVPVPKTLTAQLVGAAVIFAAVEYEPIHYREHHRLFLQIGREVAEGRNLWPRQRAMATANLPNKTQSILAV